MFCLTKNFTDTIYCASSEALLIAHGTSIGRLWKNINLSIVKNIFIPFDPNNFDWVLIYINIVKERSYFIDPMNKTNELYRDLAMGHTVVQRIFHKFKKVMKSPIEAIDHTLQCDSRSFYAEKIAKGE